MVTKAATAVDRVIVADKPTGGTVTDILSVAMHGAQFQSAVANSKHYVIPAQTVGSRMRPSQRASQKQFNRLAEQWTRETGHESFIQRAALHPAYQQIIGMGPRVIPLILRDLEETHRQWFWALRAITGQSPIPDESKGNVRKMTEAWLDWGRLNHYIN